ncbi:6-phosphofructokinase 1 [Desulfitispora alkaliphila]|uniref:diphosphate--fructose-6-phosphate 1-phosphotransferase n=1 Tax=Desulfitispora alkaliphila TaxID=622674 RepID=UPI003D208C55
MTGKKLAVAQSGGPSAVINSTLAGIIEESYKDNGIGTVIGLENGLEGLFEGRAVDLSNLSQRQISQLRETPGAILGSVRTELTGPDIERAVEILVDLDVGYFLYIGGNGTMYATHLIYEAAWKRGVELLVAGVPKTVDNDIVDISHTPGYASAAKYVARAVKDLALDLEAMKGFEQVRVVETMGRNVGWLAAASGLARKDDSQAPHLIYLPEHAFDESNFLTRIQYVVARYGYAVAVVGEGITDEKGDAIGHPAFEEKIGKSQTYGGVADYLSEQITAKLGLRSRAQNLGMAQRSFAAYRSEVDEVEAFNIGKAAVKSLLNGDNGCMTIVEEANGEALKLNPIPLIQVGGKEKKVPDHFYDNSRKQVTGEFINWLRPLVGEWQQDYLYLTELPKYKVEEEY